MTFLGKLLSLFGRDTRNSPVKNSQAQFKAPTIASGEPLQNTELSPTTTAVFAVTVVGSVFLSGGIGKDLCQQARGSPWFV